MQNGIWRAMSLSVTRDTDFPCLRLDTSPVGRRMSRTMKFSSCNEQHWPLCPNLIHGNKPSVHTLTDQITCMASGTVYSQFRFTTEIHSTLLRKQTQAANCVWNT